MGRITADRVEAAFAKCGLPPIRGDYFNANGCCGLTAVAVAEKGSAGVDLWKPTLEGFTPAIDKLGLNPFYVSGFVRGWDRPWSPPRSDEQPEHTTREYLAGFEDGSAAQARFQIPRTEAA